MDPPTITYSVQACQGVLNQLVEELFRTDSTYENGIRVIKRAMMSHFGLDHYHESMAVVYVTIDDESRDWGEEGLNTFWRSWRERSQVSRCSISTLPYLWAVSGIDKAQDARGIGADRGGGYLERWQKKVNVANNSRVRADLLSSWPQPPRPPPPQPQPPAADNGPQSSTTPGSPDDKDDNIAKRLVKAVAKVFTKRQQGPRASEGPVGLAGYPFAFKFS